MIRRLPRALRRLSVSLPLLALAFVPAAPARAQTGCGTSEWLCHASADGAHPSGAEQELLWLMNRARQDPSVEGAFLAGLDDPLVAAAVKLYVVDLDVLQDEFDAIAPKPPAAFDRRLYAAALGHANLMMSTNDDDPACGAPPQPPCQLDRVAPAGFFFVASGLRGNSFGFATSPLVAHAAWSIDWGPFFDPTVPPGMFPGRVHRNGVLSEPDAFASQGMTNAGIAVVSTEGHPTELGPLVVVADYANANTAVGDHFDRFLVGTVWEDLDADGRYDAGEGIPGVTVTPVPGNWFATTSAGGGFAIPVITPGAIDVFFAGGGVPMHAESVVVGADSVLVDYVVPEAGSLASGALALLALYAKRRVSGRSGPAVPRS
ncbi:MAG: hypothetical protein MUF70_02950 [Myxococcota bacterium]|nr:hypothetical protein [Myxococcota bacterium]